MNWTDFCTETAKQSGLLGLLRVANRRLFENRLEKMEWAKIHKGIQTNKKILHQLFQFFFCFKPNFQGRTEISQSYFFSDQRENVFPPVWTLRLQSRRRWWRSCSHSPSSVCKDVFMNVFCFPRALLRSRLSSSRCHTPPFIRPPFPCCWPVVSAEEPRHLSLAVIITWAPFRAPLQKKKLKKKTTTWDILEPKHIFFPPTPRWFNSVCTDHSGFLKTSAWAPQTVFYFLGLNANSFCAVLPLRSSCVLFFSVLPHNALRKHIGFRCNLLFI